ncbi:response regulator [bacterium]|nr:response regulator [bacterium]MDB4650564.1 response regulator [Pirellulaceae bacterium]
MGSPLSKYNEDQRPPTTYVVDDDLALLKSICDLLNSQEMDARGFTSGKSFLKAYRNDIRDCIICDYLMPDMNGLEVHKELKKIGSNAPIIFLSGKASVEMTVTAWNEGAVTVIQKPFRSTELIDAVRMAQETGQKKWCKRECLRRFDNVKAEEMDVLRYLSVGLINKQIAIRQKVSERTIERRKNHILECTGTSNFFETTELARRAGIDLTIET